MLPPYYYLAKAKRQLALAMHLWKVTYPIAKDPKLFLAIVERVKKAYAATIQVVVVYDKGQHKKKQREKTNKQLFSAYQLSQRYLTHYQKLTSLLEEYLQSPVVFHRKGALIICKDHYKKLRKLSSESIKNYLVLTELFIKAVERKCNVRRNTRKST